MKPHGNTNKQNALKPAESRKSVYLPRVRVTQAQRLEAEQEADKAGMGISKWILLKTGL